MSCFRIAEAQLHVIFESVIFDVVMLALALVTSKFRKLILHVYCKTHYLDNLCQKL